MIGLDRGREGAELSAPALLDSSSEIGPQSFRTSIVLVLFCGVLPFCGVLYYRERRIRKSEGSELLEFRESRQLLERELPPAALAVPGPDEKET